MEEIYKTLTTPGKLFAYWRTLPDMQEFVRNCYYDDVQEASERFYASEEFIEVRRWVSHYLKKDSGTLLDLGGGNGMATLAWEKSGFQSVLVEPDDDPIVGYGALTPLIHQNQTRVRIAHAYAEGLPFPDKSFDVVYVRQVLHHLPDLAVAMKEIYRVMKPNGVFIATREHVISKIEDKEAFYAKHALHKYTHGENAFLLQDYVNSIKGANFQLKKTLGYASSVINFAPISQATYKANLNKKLRVLTPFIANLITENDRLFGLLQSFVSWRNHQPGRMVTFIAVRP
jgi:ubiquinone/menaquinone biosynthesis C-methylase UbiE